jgi:hypothetical protein
MFDEGVPASTFFISILMFMKATTTGIVAAAHGYIGEGIYFPEPKKNIHWCGGLEERTRPFRCIVACTSGVLKVRSGIVYSDKFSGGAFGRC